MIDVSGIRNLQLRTTNWHSQQAWLAGGGIVATLAGGLAVSKVGALPVILAVFGIILIIAALGVVRVVNLRPQLSHSHQILPILAIASLPIVFIEPAPDDLLLIVILSLGLITGSLSIPTRGPIALLILTIWSFTITQYISILINETSSYNIFYASVTLLLCMSGLIIALMVLRFPVFANVLLRTAIWSTAVVALAVAVLYFMDIQLPVHRIERLGGRLQGFFKDPNVYGPHLMFCIIALLSIGAIPRTSQLLFRLVCDGSILVLFVASLYLTYSRGAWIATTVGLATFTLLQIARNPKTVYRVMVAIFALFIMIRFSPLLSLLYSDTLLEQRLGLRAYDENRVGNQSIALAKFQDSPLLGHGPGCANQDLAIAAHSTYVRLLFEVGLIGTLCFTAIFIGAIYYSVRTTLLSEDETLNEPPLV